MYDPEAYRELERREQVAAALPMDHAELRTLADELAFIIDAGKLDRLKQVFQERTSGTPAYHDGVRYHDYQDNPARIAEFELRRNLRDDQYKYHPLVKALVELLNIPQQQAIAVVVEREVVGYRRTMVDLIHEAHRKLSRQSRRASA